MTDSRPIWKNISIFLMLNFGISGIFYFLIIQSGKIETASFRYNFGLMWSPGIAALLTTAILKRNKTSLNLDWPKSKYIFASYFLPLTYSLIVYFILWSSKLGGFPDRGFLKATAESFGWKNYSVAGVILWQFLLVGTFGVLKGCANTLGEELGWRGFLTPEFIKIRSYTSTSIIVGLIWAVWHFPILLFADYNSDDNLVFGLICFTIMTIGLNFAYTWYTVKSKSIWPAVVFHSSHNMFIQAFLTPITIANAKTKYWYDEFGVLLAVTSLGIASYFWTRRHELIGTKNEIY